jgi:C4-dicarboxylate-specific signal transduction histidine kinase
MYRIIQLLWSRVERAAIFGGGLLLVTIGFAYDSPAAQKSVLVHYAERGYLPATQAIEENLRENFHAETASHIDLYSKYLDFTRFPVQQYEASLARYLQERYTGRRIDLVIPIILGAITFQGALIAVLVVERAWRRRAETARNKAEAQARRCHEEAAHLSRVEMLGEMAGSLAHELNQPLTAIMNNASAGRRFIAKGRADVQKLDGLFKCVVADARRAGEIIRGIRSMVHKGGGERVPVNVNHIIADVVTFTRSDALERHCTVVVEPDPNLPMVKANRVQLQQVLLNIILNAFDAMRQVPVAERRVIIRSTPRSDGCVQVSVRDFGTGLPAENPQRIFDQFFSTKRDGLGLGLAIARSIIASHGGGLAAENADGGGAFLYFSLPAIA